MPAHGLYADWEAAAGAVRLPDDFADASVFTQIKILADWRRELAAQQASIFLELFRSLNVAAGNGGRAERIEQFKTICAGEGVECPADIANLLPEV